MSERSTCKRRRYGAVIVKDDRIIATGYNGSARGEANCIDIGYCYRTAHNLPHNSGYTSDCPAVHAEQNAIMQAGAANTIGATLYLAGFEGDSSVNAEPCVMCRRAIKNAQIKRVVAFTENREVVEIEV